jgi:hypothetical protein
MAAGGVDLRVAAQPVWFCIAECSSSTRTQAPGQSVPGVSLVPSMRLPVAALLFFVSVNQVLVRLWTRATNAVCSFGCLPHLRMGVGIE